VSAVSTCSRGPAAPTIWLEAVRRIPAYHELLSASYRLRIRTTRRTAGLIAARAANPSAFVQCLRLSGVVCARSNFARTIFCGAAAGCLCRPRRAISVTSGRDDFQNGTTQPRLRRCGSRLSRLMLFVFHQFREAAIAHADAIIADGCRLAHVGCELFGWCGHARIMAHHTTYRNDMLALVPTTASAR